MPWAIELYLDDASANAIRRVRPLDLLHPHVSLSVAESIDASVEAALSDWAERQQPIPVTLDHWGMFLSESAVLFLAPRDRTLLQAVHLDFHRATAGRLGREWAYYLPEQWVPHCTVADQLPIEDLGTVALQVRELALPVAGTLSRVALVQFGSGRVERWVGPLGAAGKGD